ncbi:hypothetical protein OU995_18330 [Roseateles sp. SL47]|uniref:hypothetical protein n=1 Tax=Roseateles sp. SL47 TaxID=2995138 RepID=UPI002271E3E7|nr:hypothetical protein [Roseateles sp. SL47]WAC71530.1 hypothetical protein OU995_18330 [Roseateles sp. SL47]
MKHLSIALIALSVAAVAAAAAAIAQTKPAEGPATSSASRRQSGTVGTSPNAAQVPNPEASQVEASPLAPSSPVVTTPLPQGPATAPPGRQAGSEVQPSARTEGGDAGRERARDEAALTPRRAKRHDRN